MELTGACSTTICTSVGPSNGDPSIIVTKAFAPPNTPDTLETSVLNEGAVSSDNFSNNEVMAECLEDEYSTTMTTDHFDDTSGTSKDHFDDVSTFQDTPPLNTAEQKLHHMLNSTTRFFSDVNGG